MPPPEPELDLLQAQILVVPLLVACRVSRLPLLYMGFSFVYPPVRVLLSRPNLVNRRRPRPRSSLAGNCTSFSNVMVLCGRGISENSSRTSALWVLDSSWVASS